MTGMLERDAQNGFYTQPTNIYNEFILNILIKIEVFQKKWAFPDFWILGWSLQFREIKNKRTKSCGNFVVFR